MGRRTENQKYIKTQRHNKKSWNVRKAAVAITIGAMLTTSMAGLTGCSAGTNMGTNAGTGLGTETGVNTGSSKTNKSTGNPTGIAAKYRKIAEEEQATENIYDNGDMAVAESCETVAEDGMDYSGDTDYNGDTNYSRTNYNDGIGTIDDGYGYYIDTGTPGDTREYKHVDENPFVYTSEDNLSTWAADVDTASYSNIRSYIYSGYGSNIPADAVRIEEMINYFHYDVAPPENGDKFNVTTEYTACPWNEENNLLRITMSTEPISWKQQNTKDGKPDETMESPDGTARIPSNLVFLIDTSGSMYDENKLPLAVKAFKLLADEIDETDIVSIVTYAGSDLIALDGVTGDHRKEIIDTLEGLKAYGYTNGCGGIISAYEQAEKYFIEGGNNRVILATDGDMNVGLTSEEALTGLITEEKAAGISLSVLGFGNDNLKDNKLEALADNGDGNYAFIDSVYEAKKVLVDDMGGTLVTVAKDVKLQVDFNAETVESYRLIGYENRDVADHEFANDMVDGGEIGAGHSVTAIYEIVPAKKTSQDQTATDTGRLATINIRYKEPDGDKSTLWQRDVAVTSYNKEISADMKFITAVTAFGMKLKHSAYAGDATLEDIISWAEEGNPDGDEYRDEFAEMVKFYREDLD